MSICRNGPRRNTEYEEPEGGSAISIYRPGFWSKRKICQAGNLSTTKQSELAKRQPGVLQVVKLCPDHARIIPDLHHAIKNRLGVAQVGTRDERTVDPNAVHASTIQVNLSFDNDQSEEGKATRH